MRAAAAALALPDVPHDEPFLDFLERIARMTALDFENQALGSGFLISAALDGAGTASVAAFRASAERALPGDSVVLLVARAGARALPSYR